MAVFRSAAGSMRPVPVFRVIHIDVVHDVHFVLPAAAQSAHGVRGKDEAAVRGQLIHIPHEGFPERFFVDFPVGHGILRVPASGDDEAAPVFFLDGRKVVGGLGRVPGPDSEIHPVVYKGLAAAAVVHVEIYPAVEHDLRLSGVERFDQLPIGLRRDKGGPGCGRIVGNADRVRLIIQADVFQHLAVEVTQIAQHGIALLRLQGDRHKTVGMSHKVHQALENLAPVKHEPRGAAVDPLQVLFCQSLKVL